MIQPPVTVADMPDGAVTSRTNVGVSVVWLPALSVTTVLKAGAAALAVVKLYVSDSYGDDVAVRAAPVKPVSLIAGKSTLAIPAPPVSPGASATVKSPVAAGL